MWPFMRSLTWFENLKITVLSDLRTHRDLAQQDLPTNLRHLTNHNGADLQHQARRHDDLARCL